MIFPYNLVFSGIHSHDRPAGSRFTRRAPRVASLPTASPATYIPVRSNDFSPHVRPTDPVTGKFILLSSTYKARRKCCVYRLFKCSSAKLHILRGRLAYNVARTRGQYAKDLKLDVEAFGFGCPPGRRARAAKVGDGGNVRAARRIDEARHVPLL